MHTLGLIIYLLAAVISFRLSVRIERKVYGEVRIGEALLFTIIALLPVINMVFILLQLCVIGFFNVFDAMHIKQHEPGKDSI